MARPSYLADPREKEESMLEDSENQGSNREEILIAPDLADFLTPSDLLHPHGLYGILVSAAELRSESEAIKFRLTSQNFTFGLTFHKGRVTLFRNQDRVELE